MAVEILTKDDLKEFEAKILNAIQMSSSGSWPGRMKKKIAAQYMGTSENQIDEWRKEGRLKAQFDEDPKRKRNTPCYFNKEDLDKIRLGLK